MGGIAAFAAVGCLCVLLCVSHGILSQQALIAGIESASTQTISLLFVAFIQVAVCALCAPSVWARVRGTPSPPLSDQLPVVSVWMQGILAYLSTLLTCASYMFVGVIVTQSVKSVSPLFAVIFAYASSSRSRGIDAASAAEIGSILLICTGVMLLVRPSDPDAVSSSYSTGVLLGLGAAAIGVIRSSLADTADPAHAANTGSIHMATAAVALFSLLIGCVSAPSVIFNAFFGSASAASFAAIALFAAAAGLALAAHSTASTWLLSRIPISTWPSVRSAESPVAVLACLLFLSGAPTIHMAGIAVLCAGAGIHVVASAAQSLRGPKTPFSASRRGLVTVLVAVLLVAALTLRSVPLATFDAPDALTIKAFQLNGHVALAPILPPAPGRPSAAALSKNYTLSCFGAEGNLGDDGLAIICGHVFAAAALRVGMSLTIVPPSAASPDTILVFGGGSMLNVGWAFGQWNRTLARIGVDRPRHAVFLFGGGYDDNGLTWTHARANVDIAVGSVALALAKNNFILTSDGEFSSDGAFSSAFSPSNLPRLPIDRIGGTVTQGWPRLAPLLSFGGVRGPLSAYAFSQISREANISFPVARRVLGDAGVFAAKYISPDFELASLFAATSNGATPQYVVFVMGASSDGGFFGAGDKSDKSAGIAAEVDAFSAAAQHLVRKGYHVVFVPMSRNAPDALLVTGIAQNCTLNMPSEYHVRVSFIKSVPPMPKMLGLMANAAAVVAHKLHGGVFAGAVGTPFVAIAYRLKHYDWALSIDALELVVHLEDLTAERLIERLEYVERNRERIRAHLLGMVEVYAERYERAADEYLRHILSTQ